MTELVQVARGERSGSEGLCDKASKIRAADEDFSMGEVAESPIPSPIFNAQHAAAQQPPPGKPRSSN